MKHLLTLFYILCLASFLLSSILLSISVSATEINCDKTKDCTFALLDLQTNKLTLKNVPRALKRFTPFSTFKVANTLYGIETGVIKSIDQELKWDSEKYPAQAWWPKSWLKTPHTIHSAFTVSALPYFQTLIHRYDREKLTQELQNYRYGNYDTSSSVDKFWLDESLQISAIEQAKFLKRIFTNRQIVNEKDTSLLKHIMVNDQLGKFDTLKVYGKTGGGMLDKDNALGWYIGALEKDKDSYFFAVNVSGSSFKEVQQRRIDIAKHYLKQLKLLPTK